MAQFSTWNSHGQFLSLSILSAPGRLAEEISLHRILGGVGVPT
jgi:hypothetical protein